MIGMLDSLALPGSNFKAIAGLSGSTKKLTDVYEAVFSGRKMENVHQAAGGVVGLVKIILASESMKACL